MVTNGERGGWRRPVKIASVNLLVLIGLYLLMEAALHIVWDGRNLLLPKNVLRVPHPVYHHTLKANFDGYDIWGPLKNRIFTNSLGFKDAALRDVPLVPDRKRILFIGDSFTEGIGLSYEDTFVGQFAAAFPQIEVLNAGVGGYSPSVYYEKVKYLLDHGLKFDEAIVYIDISDIQNEAQDYYYDEKGVLRIPTDIPDACPHLPEKVWWQKAFFVADFISEVLRAERFTKLIDKASLETLKTGPLPFGPEVPIASWTYNPNTRCYGKIGVQGGIDKAKWQMDRLYEILHAHGVPISVGVYPWAQQLLYDTEDSRQAQIWRDWCAGRCKAFYNHFPAFFRYKDKNPDFLRDLYIWGDHHFVAGGNKVISDDLIPQYRNQ